MTSRYPKVPMPRPKRGAPVKATRVGGAPGGDAPAASGVLGVKFIKRDGVLLTEDE